MTMTTIGAGARQNLEGAKATEAILKFARAMSSRARRYYVRRKAAWDLHHMSDRDLEDMGIGRDEIDARILRGLPLRREGQTR